MRKIKKPISIKIRPIRLFLEDVKEIENVFKEHCETYTILTDDYELESLEELEKIGKEKITGLSFKSSKPDISLNISKNGVSIYSSPDNEDITSTGILSKLKDILSAR